MQDNKPRYSIAKYRYSITYKNAQGKNVSVIRPGKNAVEVAKRFADSVGWWWWTISMSITLMSGDRGDPGQEWASGYFILKDPHEKVILADIVLEEPPCC